MKGYTIITLLLLLICLKAPAQTFTSIDVAYDEQDTAYALGDAYGLVVAGGKIFFRATFTGTGSELGVTDGTPEGTMVVKDIQAGFSPSGIGQIIPVNSKVFFTATDNARNNELWVSDGTTAGTYLVKDIDGDPLESSEPNNLCAFNNKIYFNALNQLWSSDGTDQGTMMVKNINAQYQFYVVDTHLYFPVSVNLSNEQLWLTDGTTAGTRLVKDFTGVQTGTLFFSQMNGQLYFQLDDGIVGRELWTSNGTDSGTVMVKDINAGSGGSTPMHMTAYNGKLYFAADDGITGNELWVSDGTGTGTTLLMDINTTGDSNPRDFYEHNGKLYFQAGNGIDGVELWVTDGSPAGTLMLKDITQDIGDSEPHAFTTYRNKLYFIAGGYINEQLWVTDGTTAGTYLLQPDNAIGVDPIDAGSLIVYDGRLVFSANYDFGGVQKKLWFFDDAPVGIRSTSKEIKPLIYPNPFTDHITIAAETALGNCSVTIMEITGRTVAQYEKAAGAEKTASIAVSALPSGVYILQLQFDKAVINYKLIRE